MTDQEKHKALRRASGWVVSGFVTVLVMVIVIAISESIVRRNNGLLVLDRDEWECSDNEPDGCAEWRRRGVVRVLPQSAQR